METIPLYRFTFETIDDLITLHDSQPELGIHELLKILEIEPDYTEYGV